MLSFEIIESALAPFEPEHIFIAYSGGMDSHALLHLAAANAAMRKRITAVYVHHGLQADADVWARHTARTSEELAVAFVLLEVKAAARKGESPEEAARNARYSALKDLLDAQSVLLVAHHLEDQLETVLLQLLRGSGLPGLSGMPEWKAFGRGFLLRPLLGISKQAISDYADHYRLHYVEDTSNQRNEFDRNFLRNEVLPLLKQRWPACASTVARAAKHCAEAQGLMNNWSEEVFKRIHNSSDHTLSISRLRAFDRARQQLAIRHWFQTLGLKMPSRDFVSRLLEQLAAPEAARHPEWSNQGYWLRRYRDKLYCLKSFGPELLEEKVWPSRQRSIEIGQHRVLSWRAASAGIPAELWLQADILVKYRRGGEKIGLPGRTGRHSLKNLYQEAGIPPWERDRIPLIYLNGHLAAVGDRWISADFYSKNAKDCVVLSVQGHARC